MNYANYKGQETGYYPLRSDSLDFIQQQIMFLQKLHLLVSKTATRVIIQEPAADKAGLVLIDGEFIEYRHNASGGDYINVYEVSTDLTEGENTFPKYQVVRFARRGTPGEYTIGNAVKVGGSYRVSEFYVVDLDLLVLADKLKTHTHTGKDGSGKIDYANIANKPVPNAIIKLEFNGDSITVVNGSIDASKSLIRIFIHSDNNVIIEGDILFVGTMYGSTAEQDIFSVNTGLSQKTFKIDEAKLYGSDNYAGSIGVNSRIRVANTGTSLSFKLLLQATGLPNVRVKFVMTGTLFTYGGIVGQV